MFCIWTAPPTATTIERQIHTHIHTYGGTWLVKLPLPLLHVLYVHHYTYMYVSESYRGFYNEQERDTWPYLNSMLGPCIYISLSHKILIWLLIGCSELIYFNNFVISKYLTTLSIIWRVYTLQPRKMVHTASRFHLPRYQVGHGH